MSNDDDEQMICGQSYMIAENRPIISMSNPDTYYFGNYISKTGNIYKFNNVEQINNNRNNFFHIQLGEREFSSHTHYFVMTPPFPTDGKKKSRRSKSQKKKSRKSKSQKKKSRRSRRY